MTTPRSYTPPRWAKQVLQWRCPEDQFEELEGDLEELFQGWVQEVGGVQARRRYVRHVLGFLRPVPFRKSVVSRCFNTRHHAVPNPFDMLKSYLTVAFRNLVRSKVYSAINIVGLAIGVASSVLLLQYILFERSYDQFHQKADRIFRIRFDYFQDGKPEFQLASTYSAVGPALRQDYAQVEAYTRLIAFNEGAIIGYQQRVFFEKKLYYAEASLFELFSFRLLEGDAKTALSQPNTVVISQSSAKKLLGNEAPVGKTITLNAGQPVPLQIVGVFEDVPENSHLKFDYLVSYPTTYPWGWTKSDWGSLDVFTYVLLKPGTDPATLQAKLPAFIDKYEGEAMRKTNSREELTLQPLGDIHLHSTLTNELEVNGNHTIVLLLSLIAVFILLIAWINYLNIASARALERAKEVGIRKVAGANGWQTALQFLLETLVLNGLAVLVAAGLVVMAQPHLAMLAGKALPLAVLSDLRIVSLLVITLLVGILLTGAYPAIVLASFNMVEVVKGKLKSTPRGRLMRKTMVVFQFTASVLLLIGTLAVYQQVGYMQSQHLGVNLEQVLVVNAPQVNDSTFSQGLSFFKHQLQNLSQVSSVAASTAVPGEEVGRIQNFRRINLSQQEKGAYRVIGTDEQFFRTYQNRFLAGSNFSSSLQKKAVIINQAALQALQFKDPQAALGQHVSWQERNAVFEIVGVIENYHQQSLKTDFVPTVFFHNPAAWGYFSLKLRADQLENTLSQVENSWRSSYPGHPFTFFFLDDFFERQYQQDRQFGRLFSVFSVIAGLIACLGLFSLSYFTAQQRTKEVGVRKVLGADVSRITALLVGEFMQLILLAILIAWPLAYWAARQWLAGYAFHIQLEPWHFLLPGLTVLLISLLTVSYHTVRIARANPVNALRLE